MGFRIGLLKAVPKKWDLDANMQMFELFLRKAKKENVQLFITCECFLDGYCVTDEDLDYNKFVGIAQNVNDSCYINRVRELAEELQIMILFGFTSLCKEGVKNSAILISEKGKDIGMYSKTHLMEHDTNFIEGDDLPVFNTNFGTIGILICADRRWPEAMRTLRVKGANLILVPTYGMCGFNNECWMKTRAYENECYVVFCHPSKSLICNPEGNVEATLVSNTSGLLVHNLETDRFVPTMFDFRRQDLYKYVVRNNDENSY